MRPQRVHNFGTYFVSAQTWGRRSLFQAELMAGLFVNTLYRYRSEGRFLLHEFVLMPEHFHLIVTPIGITIERTMQFIKGGFSYRVKKELNSAVEVWQRGSTDHRIRSYQDYLRHVEYIRMNPLRAGICENPEVYPYSSASGKFLLDECPPRLKALPADG